MTTAIRAALGALLVLLVSLALGAPAAQAEPSIRSATVADLYLRADKPSKDAVKRSFAAFMNPSLPMGPKLEVSVNGAANRGELQRMMDQSRQHDFFSMKGDVVAVNVSGNAMNARFQGSMAGFPVQSFTYYYVRQGGLWKYDWKHNAAANGMPAKFV